MSKQDILIDQIINIANGLSTEALALITDKLETLEKNKTEEVLKSITQEELQEIRSLHNLMQIEQTFEVDVNIQCVVNLGFADDGTGIILLDENPYLNIEHISGSSRLQNAFEKRDILKIAEINSAYQEYKQDLAALSKILKNLAAKYKLEPYTILQYAIENYDD
jgi:hypothetical protein